MPTADLIRARAAMVATAVAIAAGSVVVAALAALVSRMAWRPGVVALPWGLLLSIAASCGVVLLARAIGRQYGFAAAGGWIVGTGLVLGGRPEGDYLFAQDWLGLCFIFIAPVLVITCAASGGRTP